jgi:hypothetical protein
MPNRTRFGCVGIALMRQKRHLQGLTPELTLTATANDILNRMTTYRINAHGAF